jgi:hypothetical protein
MNTALPCYSDFFGVASSRTGSRFDTVEVRSSSLLVPTISFFQYSRAFRPLLTALEQSDFIPSAPVQHPLVDGLRFRRDPFKRMAEAMGAEPLDQSRHTYCHPSR